MRTAFLFLILGVAADFLSAAHAEDKIVKAKDLPLPRFFVEDGDKRLLDEAPKDGVIADAKAWAKFWKTWGGDQEVPKVDFEKELVLVAAGPGPNVIKVEDLKLNDKGDLSFKWSITERAGPGITAKFLKVSREGVKTVNGKVLPNE
jgi:hypothetical protein